jgi:hypothetical protein
MENRTFVREVSPAPRPEAAASGRGCPPWATCVAEAISTHAEGTMHEENSVGDGEVGAARGAHRRCEPQQRSIREGH